MTDRVGLISDFSRKAQDPDVMTGLAIAVLAAGVATAIAHAADTLFLSPLVAGLAIGILFASVVPEAERFHGGYDIAAKSLLKLGVALLGLQLGIGKVLAVGGSALFIACGAGLVALAAVALIGRLIGLDRRAAILVAFGTGICGASAILAAAALVDPRERDVAAALVLVSVIGAIGVMAAPFAFTQAGLGSAGFGIWVGASLQEVAQAVGAACAVDATACEAGTVAKILRVLLLAPALAVLAAVERSGGAAGDIRRWPVPGFILGFAALAMLVSVVSVPRPLLDSLRTLSLFLLTLSLTGIGLKTRLKDLIGANPRMLALALIGFAVIVASAYGFSRTWLWLAPASH